VADYGWPVVAAVQQGNVLGFQFHPEKSGAVGMAMLRRFVELDPDSLKGGRP
jgi:glutamine amidotransferase